MHCGPQQTLRCRWQRYSSASSYHYWIVQGRPCVHPILSLRLRCRKIAKSIADHYERTTWAANAPTDFGTAAAMLVQSAVPHSIEWPICQRRTMVSTAVMVERAHTEDC